MRNVWILRPENHRTSQHFQTRRPYGYDVWQPVLQGRRDGLVPAHDDRERWDLPDPDRGGGLRRADLTPPHRGGHPPARGRGTDVGEVWRAVFWGASAPKAA